MIVRLLLLILILAGATPNLAENGIPKLTPDELAVYQAFLATYTNGSSAVLNLAKAAKPIVLSEPSDCLQGIQLDLTDSSNPRPLTEDIAGGVKLRLVDPDQQRKLIGKNDPGRTMRRKGVNGAVSDAFATSLLEFSTIAFDRTHRFAVMTYSFYCGGLCGHGGTVVFEKVAGTWKQANRVCSRWIA